MNKLFFVLAILLVTVLILSLSPTFAEPIRSPTSATSTQTPESLTSTPTASVTDNRINSLEARVDSLKSFVEIQSRSYDAAVSRMESNLNLLLAILAITSVVVALVWFGSVRLWITNTVQTQLKQATAEEVKKVAEAELQRIRSEWEPKFAQLYEEYHKIISRK
jgi:hypothetical protein